MCRSDRQKVVALEARIAQLEREKAVLEYKLSTSMLSIGMYSLGRFGENDIWIGQDDGEGGSFREDVVAKVIAEFYNRNF